MLDDKAIFLKEEMNKNDDLRLLYWQTLLRARIGPGMHFREWAV